MRVAGYVRVSSLEQADNLSIPTQIRLINEYAARQGWYNYRQVKAAAVSLAPSGMAAPRRRFGMDQSSSPTRICTKCGEEKPLNSFHKDKECKGGRKPRCAACCYAVEKVWAGNPDVRARKRMRENEDRAANREKYRQKNRAVYHADVEKYRDGQREYRNRRNDIARLNVRERIRRQQFVEQTGRSAKRVDYSAILQRDGYICQICKGAIVPQMIANVHFDHVIPISKGGNHSSDNIVVTHTYCNIKKRDKLPDDKIVCVG